MKTIKASEFKAKWLHLMDQVERTGESIVITKTVVRSPNSDRSAVGRIRCSVSNGA